MRSKIAALASTVATIAFHSSLAIWPDRLQQWAWTVKYLWALSVLLWMIWIFSHPWLAGRRKSVEGKVEEPSTSHAGPIINISPTISPTISPVIAAQLSPRNVSVQPDMQATSNPVKTKDSPTIGLVKNKPRVEWLALDDNFIWSISRVKTKSLGIAVPLYNDPQQSDPGAELKYAKAHLVFTDEATKERTIVPAACWIGEEFNWANLEPGDQKFVVLVVVSDVWENPIAIGTSRDFSDWYRRNDDGEVPLSDHPLELHKSYLVELCLLGGGNGEFRQVYKFHLSIVETLRAAMAGSPT
jgi:hypothetical protein